MLFSIEFQLVSKLNLVEVYIVSNLGLLECKTSCKCTLTLRLILVKRYLESKSNRIRS